VQHAQRFRSVTHRLWTALWSKSQLRNYVGAFTVGAPPTALYAELHAVAAAAFDGVARCLVPGAHARDLAAAGSVIEEAGFTGIDDLVHGFGGGYLPPVVPAPGRRLPVPEFVLAAGMTLVVQPNVVSRGEAPLHPATSAHGPPAAGCHSLGRQLRDLLRDAGHHLDGPPASRRVRR
jgi:hypothetical protein